MKIGKLLLEIETLILDRSPLKENYLTVTFVSDESPYDVHQTSEAALLKTFAFATKLIKILDDGLKNFCLARYRQLNKRLGKMIRFALLVRIN